MMCNLLCTTLTMPSPMEEDLPSHGGIAQLVQLVKEVVSVHWMLKESILCIPVLMADLVVSTATNIVRIGQDKDTVTITTWPG